MRKLVLFFVLTLAAKAQILQPILLGGYSEMDFTLPAPNATFNLTYTNSGATLHWIFPAGSVPATIDSNNPTVNATAGVIRVQSRDGFKGVTSISDNFNGLVFTGTLPTLPSGLTQLSLYFSTFTGTLPTLPSGLTQLYLGSSTFTGYTAGGFATQASLSTSYVQFANVADVNSALVDAVTSLGISGRSVCNPFWIDGSSPAPTGAGIAAKATLISAGWTVTTN
jgi:hypothetical protein